MFNDIQYGAICADPPWYFKNYSGKGEGRNATAHYDCMSLEQIKEMRVPDFSAPDCALFLWATDPLLPEALEVIRAWGFTFKTVAFQWAKTRRRMNDTQPVSRAFPMGTGYWTRANVELCLLATRGRPRRLSKGVSRLIVAPRREHSRKPDEVYQAITELVGGPYLELFARESRPGWNAWGNQTGLFDEGPVNTRRVPAESSGILAGTPTPP